MYSADTIVARYQTFFHRHKTAVNTKSKTNTAMTHLQPNHRQNKRRRKQKHNPNRRTTNKTES
jgi:hypothetical protein